MVIVLEVRVVVVVTGIRLATISYVSVPHLHVTIIVIIVVVVVVRRVKSRQR